MSKYSFSAEEVANDEATEAAADEATEAAADDAATETDAAPVAATPHYCEPYPYTVEDGIVAFKSVYEIIKAGNVSDHRNCLLRCAYTMQGAAMGMIFPCDGFGDNDLPAVVAGNPNSGNASMLKGQAERCQQAIAEREEAIADPDHPCQGFADRFLAKLIWRLAEKIYEEFKASALTL